MISSRCVIKDFMKYKIQDLLIVTEVIQMLYYVIFYLAEMLIGRKGKK